MVSFACYVLTNENNTLTPEKAFVSLSLFNIIKLPLTFLPVIISQTIQVSMNWLIKSSIMSKIEYI